MQLATNGRPIDELAIDRIREFCPPEGYYVAFSGGKDSVVILDLVHRAGVPYDAHHHLTTVDPPELVRFTRTFPEVEIRRPPLTMWQLIAREGIPPLRQARYCCKHLKEHGGDGRVVLTGIRWAESSRRSQRRMTEACRAGKGKRFVHPIIDWTTSDVWDYIRERGLRYCGLYDEGFKRLGCVLCPMVDNPHLIRQQMERWPRLAARWKRAVMGTWRKDVCRARSPEDHWEWWIARHGSGKPSSDPVLFEDDPGLSEPGQ